MLTIHTSRVGQTTIFYLAGRLDSINAALLQQTLFPVIETEGLTDIVLDMSAVQYISAAGLRVLRQLYERTGSVRLASPSPRVMEVMQITGLDVLYRLYETRTAALHSILPITNAHTHLELSFLKHLCPGVGGMPFVPWLRGRVRQALLTTRDLDQQMRAAAEAGVQQLIEAGVTMVADISVGGLSVAPLLASGLRGVVYIELLARHPQQLKPHLRAVQELIATLRQQERSSLKIGLQIHAPYSVHPELWREALRYAESEALPLCIHVAESPAEQEYFLHGTGDLAAAFPEEDAPHPAPGRSPVAYLEDLGALALKPLLVHAVQVDDADIARIQQAGCTVVHCPRSNLRLRCGRMPLEKFVAAGVPVLLGTDSLASAPSLNIFDELEIAAALHYGHVSPAQLLEMVHRTLPGLP
ncbi:MAG: anti-sigma factor antagonist [Anaerolineae bacterium]|jgi:anti-anti-sigma factor|nr:anti-sigma factor antagonist [Anaerolineae bacterium]